ncbi:cysteine desulfurase family protein [Brevibacillus ginsengisoli]|uniref:cysteine desulfurase family protein n=1 Tax=Brevibacillus ginsengisoli TaxID=363854 RepID=UPI003CE9FEA7
MTNLIYLDHASTTPMHPRVMEVMNAAMSETFGNPSSTHGFGRIARQKLEKARDLIAKQLGANPGELIFTSGGTEADNLAIFGVAMANQHRGRHIITTQIEHHAVLHACEQLEQMGFEVTYLPVDTTGMISLEELEKTIRQDTILVSIMYGNNEVGTVQPIHAIGELVRAKGSYFHTDAVQAFGVESINVQELPVDLLSVTAHKINGPKGVGALYAAKHVKLSPHQFGGSQERKRRAGTENVAGAVGFAEAVFIAAEELENNRKKYQAMRDAMLSIWQDAGIAFEVNGHPEKFLPHILNVSFVGIDTETMLMNLDLEGIAASSGSACTSGSLELSHVLVAMHLGDARTHSAIRFSFGLANSIEQVQEAARKIVSIVKRICK